MLAKGQEVLFERQSLFMLGFHYVDFVKERRKFLLTLSFEPRPMFDKDSPDNCLVGFPKDPSITIGLVIFYNFRGL